MPRYEYVCDKCGHREDQVRPVSARDTVEACPACPRPRCMTAKPPGNLKRDVMASMRPHTDTGYQVPILSNAAGIHVSQIAEAKQKFPHHEFTPDGRMVFNSHSHRERCLRDIGMYDRN